MVASAKRSLTGGSLGTPKLKSSLCLWLIIIIYRCQQKYWWQNEIKKIDCLACNQINRFYDAGEMTTTHTASTHLTELFASGPPSDLPLSFCTNLALDLRIDALSLENEPLRFNLPV